MNVKGIELYHGDCLEVMPKVIPSNSIDFIFADLPFGTTRAKWDCPIDLLKLWPEYKRIIKPNGAIVLNAQLPFDKVLGASNLPMLRYEWVWEKSNATGSLNAKRMPMKAHELLLVFYKKLPTYNYQKTTGHKRKTATAAQKAKCKMSNLYGEYKAKGYDSTERFPRSVLKFKDAKYESKLWHETQKPMELAEYMIKTYSNEGDTVLDNVSGSNTYSIAALKLNRKPIAIEKYPDKFEAGLARIHEEA